MHPIQEYLDKLSTIGLKVAKPIALLDKSNFDDTYTSLARTNSHRFEVHCCYKNAYELMQVLRFEDTYLRKNIKELRYCEGFMTVCGIPIEHGWVRVIFDDNTDVYLDPTKSIVLKESLNEFTHYAVMLEYTWEELIDKLLSEKKFGPYFHAYLQ